MSNVTTKWILDLSDRLSGPMDRITSKVIVAQTSFSRLSTRVKNLRVDFRDVANEVPGLTRALTLMANPLALAAAGLIAVGTVGAVATKSAYNFEQGMAKINATAQLTQPKLAALRGELMQIGSDSDGNFKKIPESFEKILSQVGNADKSLEILKASALGAKAGFTELDVVSGALSQSMSIISDNNVSAQQVLDTFTAAKRVGAGEFKDFAEYLPTIIAAGSQLGITYEKTAGLFAYMTGKGQDASNAQMLIQNAYTALGKSDITSGLKTNLGVNVFDKQGAIRDIGTIMNEIGAKLKSLTPEGQSLILEKIGLRDVQAKNAFAILTSDAGKLTEAMNATANSAGETQRALESTANPAQKWHSIMDKVNFLLTKIGYKLLPYVNKFFDKLGVALDWVKSHSSLLSDVLKGLWNSFVIITLPIKWLLELLWALKIPLLVIGALILFVTSPFTFWILVITAVITGLTVLWNRSEKFRGTIMGLVEVVKGFGSALKNYVLDTVKSLISGITGLGNVFSKLFSGDFKGAFESGKQVVKDFATVGKNMSGFGIAEALYNEGKTSGAKFTAGYTEGALQVATKDWKPNFMFDNGTVDANNIGGNKTTKTDPVITPSAKEKISGVDSGSGSGKSITMRLDIKNYFNGVASDLDKHVDDFAAKFVTKINDGLRDAVVALD